MKRATTAGECIQNRRTGRTAWVVLLGLALLAMAPAARAVIFYATADPDHNTTAPTGPLAGSGWQWVGTWGGFQGTAIGPHHFLAAHHTGGTVGDPFVLGGITYTTTAVTNATASDLAIWEISGTFPSWAPLYRGTSEAGQAFVVFGRGVPRGGEIRVSGVLKGWFWGVGDGRLRWGTNTFSSVVDGGGSLGPLLRATFDQAADGDEADLGVGDSSGPLFLNDGSGWKLAGIAEGVDAYFSTTPSGNGFSAAIFDARGLYFTSTPPNGWGLIGGPAVAPTGFVATRISAQAAWIDSIVPPAPVSNGSDAPLFSGPVAALLALTLVATGIRLLRRTTRQTQEA